MPTTKGEKTDMRKGVWFCWLVPLTAIAAVFFPPLALLGLGMIVMLFFW